MFGLFEKKEKTTIEHMLWQDKIKGRFNQMLNKGFDNTKFVFIIEVNLQGDVDIHMAGNPETDCNVMGMLDVAKHVIIHKGLPND